MNMLLDILEKYDFKLFQETEDVVDFLEHKFNGYIRDLSRACSKSLNMDIPEDIVRKVDGLIDQIENNCGRLISIIKAYKEGENESVELDAFSLFSECESFLLYHRSGDFRKETYYRIRSYDDSSPFPIIEKELFHIPYSKRDKASADRYSIKGHPCLYLSSQPQLCWYECGRPTNFVVAQFCIPQEEDAHFIFLNFSEDYRDLKYSYKSWFHSYDKSIVWGNLIKHLYSYPFRAACSIPSARRKTDCIEEFIIPQLLMKWISQNELLDGIMYQPCKDNSEVRCYGGHNIAMLTKDYDEEGFDKKLRREILVDQPIHIDIDKMPADRKNDPFQWGMENCNPCYKKI